MSQSNYHKSELTENIIYRISHSEWYRKPVKSTKFESSLKLHNLFIRFSTRNSLRLYVSDLWFGIFAISSPWLVFVGQLLENRLVVHFTAYFYRHFVVLQHICTCTYIKVKKQVCMCKKLLCIKVSLQWTACTIN